MKKLFLFFFFSAPLLVIAQTNDTTKARIVHTALTQPNASQETTVESGDVIKVSTSLKKAGEGTNETPSQNQSPAVQEHNSGLVRPKHD